MRGKNWNPIFKWVDPTSKDVHTLYEKYLNVSDHKIDMSRDPDEVKPKYAYTSHDRNGRLKNAIEFANRDSAKKHLVKKTGQDPFREVVISD